MTNIEVTLNVTVLDLIAMKNNAARSGLCVTRFVLPTPTIELLGVPVVFSNVDSPRVEVDPVERITVDVCD